MAENTFTPYAHMTIPQKFVSRPFETKPNEQGKIYTKAIVTMPKGVSVNGIDLSGYKASLFMSDRAMQQKVAGEPCTFMMDPDRVLKMRMDRPDGSHVELFVRPWDLAKAVKAQRETLIAERARERAASVARRADYGGSAVDPDFDGDDYDEGDEKADVDADSYDDSYFVENPVNRPETLEEIIAAAHEAAAYHAAIRRHDASDGFLSD